MKTEIMEKNREQVNIHSRLTVVSSTPTEPMGLTCGLSPIDHIMGCHTAHIIFYYRTSPFLPKGRFSMDLDNFRISLSELLSKYPRITGRLVRDQNGHGNWLVKYNDAGVRMFKAEVGVTVDEWLRSADESDERNLTVWEDMPDGNPISWSPFQIQISEFVGGGLAVGLSFTHLLADPTAATLFYKSWTDSERGETTGNRPPVFDLPLLNNRPPPATATGNTSTTAKYLQKHSKIIPTDPPTKMATSTFKFSNKSIEKHLSEIADKSPNATPFDYLTTLFWSRIIKLKNPVNSPSLTQSISLCIDTRKLLDVPIPNKFFGNAISFSELSLENEILTGDNGLAEAVESVHRHVVGIKKDDIFSTVDWVESSRKELNGVYLKPVQMYGPDLTFVSLEHLMISKEGSKDEFESVVYEAKFRNNEKPVHVSYHVGKVEGEGLIVVGPSPEGGMGRTVTVTLPAEVIGKLCEDPVIMEMEPIMILSGKR